jgi:ParB family chromosome partitioning protein
MGHGRAIINIENQDIQTDIYQKIVSQNLSVRETEALVKNYQESLKPKPAKKVKSESFQIADTKKNTFNTFFGTKVDIKVIGNGKGKISIPFHSEEDFNRIIKLIKG